MLLVPRKQMEHFAVCLQWRNTVGTAEPDPVPQLDSRAQENTGLSVDCDMLIPSDRNSVARGGQREHQVSPVPCLCAHQSSSSTLQTSYRPLADGTTSCGAGHKLVAQEETDTLGNYHRPGQGSWSNSFPGRGWWAACFIAAWAYHRPCVNLSGGGKKSKRTIKICTAKEARQYITGVLPPPGSSVSPHGGMGVFYFCFSFH